MKTKYPEYQQGAVEKMENKLSKHNKEILGEFSKICAITAGEKRVEKIRRMLTQFQDVTELDFDKQTKDSVNSFLVVLNNSNRSIPTKNEIKGYLKKFLIWKYKNLEMVENIKRTNQDFNPEKVNENNLITEEELEKMLRHAINFKEKAFLTLAFESGARPQEIVNLKWSDIKFEEDYADIKFYSGKTKQVRTFPVKKSREFLWYWKENYSFENRTNNDYVFPSRQDKHKPMTTAGLNRILTRLAEKAGINRKIWSYLFRHSRATRLYEELPTPIVEKLMGHKDMYKVYAHISSKKAREEMLNKIYKIEELTPQEKEELTKLRSEVKELVTQFELIQKQRNKEIEDRNKQFAKLEKLYSKKN